jgi:hypothetical protein
VWVGVCRLGYVGWGVWGEVCGLGCVWVCGLGCGLRCVGWGV